ncbi:MAG: ABC transporter permease [Myxococcota bacterium]
MNIAHLFGVYQAEIERLFRRPTAIAGWVLSALFGLIGPLFVAIVNFNVIAPQKAYMEADLGAAEVAAMEALEGSPFIGWDWSVILSFSLRNLMFLPILIFLLGGLSMASEFAARTTREDVLRPIHRWQLLLCKWAALITWIVVAIGLTSMLSSILGLLINGGFTFEDTLISSLDDLTTWEATQAYAAWLWSPVGAVITQVVTTFVLDLGFATVALCIAVLTRSVAATVAFLVILFTTQLALFATLSIATSDMVEGVVAQQTPWLNEASRESLFGWLRFMTQWQPPFVLGTCDMLGVQTPWQSFVTLAVITIVAMLTAVARFETMDVP